ncbi:MAG: GNAT family N-acetyltransferase [Myxococcaceae bacterium]
MSQALPTQLRIHRSIRDIPREAWNALVDPASRPFVDHRYLSALEDSGCARPASGFHARHLCIWQGNRLVAAAPAYVKDDARGEFVFDGSWATASERLGQRWYPKLVLGIPFTPATGRRFLVAQNEDAPARRAQLLRGAIEFARSETLSSIHVHFQHPDENLALEAEGFALRYGVQYQWRNQGYASFEDFLARFRSSRRTQIRRERSAIAKAGITVRTLRGDALRSVTGAEMEALYVTTVNRNYGERFLNEAFFTALLRELPEHVEFTEATKDGRRIAGAFNLSGDGALYGRYWGSFEHQPFLHFNVCLYHPIEECIARSVARFEPGAGGEHKLTRGLPPSLTHSAHLVFHPVLDSAVRRYLESERAAILSGLPSWQSDTGLKAGGRA